MVRQFLVSVVVLLAAPLAFEQGPLLQFDGLAVYSLLPPGTSTSMYAYYENDGPGAAADVKMTITIPAGLTYQGYVAHAPFQCTEPPKGGQGDLVCTASSLDVISSDFIQVDVVVDPAANSTLTSLTERATAVTQSDPDFSDNDVSASTAVLPLPPATLKLTLTADPDVVHSGDQLTYTAKIVNTSNADAQNIDLAWELAPETLSATNCAFHTFNTLAAGTTLTFACTVRVNAAAGTQLTDTARVTATNVTFDAQSDTATVTTNVAGTPPPFRRRAVRH